MSFDLHELIYHETSKADCPYCNVPLLRNDVDMADGDHILTLICTECDRVYIPEYDA